MPTLSISVSDDVYSELTAIADQLKQTPEECALLAMNHFLQTDTIENALEGIARMDDNEALIDFPELKEELGLDVKFHPMAMEELEDLEEDAQIEVLEHLIERITGEPDALNPSVDLVLKKVPEGDVITSVFHFGDIVYVAGPAIVIYHIALGEEIDDEDDEDGEEE